MKHDKKDLIFSVTKRDLKITYFSGSGAGGQHRNRHNNCVRINHPETGVTAQGTESKSLTQNKKLAFTRLVKNKKFYNWLKVTASYLLEDGKTIAEIVDDMMAEENLKVEKKVNNKWVDVNYAVEK